MRETIFRMRCSAAATNIPFDAQCKQSLVPISRGKIKENRVQTMLQAWKMCLDHIRKVKREDLWLLRFFSLGSKRLLYFLGLIAKLFQGEAKLERREDQVNNAAVGPKLDTLLPEGDTVVIKMGVVLKPGVISPPKACTPSPHLCNDRDTVSVGLDVKKIFF